MPGAERAFRQWSLLPLFTVSSSKSNRGDDTTGTRAVTGERADYWSGL